MEMICPKAKECTCNDCTHKTPHIKDEYFCLTFPCQRIDGFEGTTCIPYTQPSVLSDEEMAKAQGDKDRCLAIIHGFDTCKGCSANCHAIATAQDAKTRAVVASEIFTEFGQILHWTDDDLSNDMYVDHLEFKALKAKYGIGVEK